jgi:hypothetical protein
MRRGVTLIELLVIGLLLFLLLGAAAMLTRAFVAPSYQLLVWGLGLLMMGAYLGAVIVGLRQLGRRASLWAEFGRRLVDFRRACADFALVLPEGVEWSSKRGLLDGGAALALETHERLVHAVQRFERVLDDYPALKGEGSAPGELIVRRRGEQWQLFWRVEGVDDRLHSEGPLSEATPGST